MARVSYLFFLGLILFLPTSIEASTGMEALNTLKALKQKMPPAKAPEKPTDHAEIPATVIKTNLVRTFVKDLRLKRQAMSKSEAQNPNLAQ